MSDGAQRAACYNASIVTDSIHTYLQGHVVGEGEVVHVGRRHHLIAAELHLHTNHRSTPATGTLFETRTREGSTKDVE